MQSRKAARLHASHNRSSKRSYSRGRKESHPNLLEKSNDWKLLVDSVPDRITFPACVGVDTLQRPDIILYSESLRTVIWAELTVPLEENMSQAILRKTIRYTELAGLCKARNWIVHPFTIEVGSIGFVAPTLRRFLHQVGVPKKQSLWVERDVSRISTRCSYLIWSSRFERKWVPTTMISIPDISLSSECAQSVRPAPVNSIAIASSTSTTNAATAAPLGDKALNLERAHNFLSSIPGKRHRSHAAIPPPECLKN